MLISEDFISTGCTLLDCRLGGGVPMRRLFHLVGDPSTNKTGIAIELVANFLRKYPNGKVMYCDTEAAFSPEYAEKLGMPVDDVKFVEAEKQHGITLEDLANQLNKFVMSIKEDEAGLFIWDSLDTTPTLEESTVPFEKRKRGYGVSKAKALGEILRSTTQKIQKRNVCFVVISQTRVNVEGYGPKKIFSGGEAPKFYASQRLVLKKVETLKKKIDKNEHQYGIRVEGHVDKNKVAPPDRRIEFDIVQDYGIDDLATNLKWLAEMGMLSLLPDDLLTSGMKEDDDTEDDDQAAAPEDDEEEEKKATKRKKAAKAVAPLLKKIRSLPNCRQIEQQVAMVAKTYCETVEKKLSDSLPKGKYAPIEQPEKVGKKNV